MMLDGDARDDALALQERIESLRRVSLSSNKPGRVVIARLPDGQDPGDCTPEQIAAAIRRALRQGVSGRSTSSS